jgi:exosortase D (VPLPA-CTERM-specific)
VADGSSLFLTTIPVTVLMNSLRIAAVGVLVQRWGGGMADGFMHYFEGWIIFIACLLTLLAEIWLFERFGARRKILDVLMFPSVRGGGAVNVDLPLARHPIVVGMALLLAAGIAAQAVAHREEVRPERTSLAAFPLTLEKWQASKSLMETEVEIFLGLEDYVIADYRREDQIVNFYAAFYGSQRKGVSPHSPQVCIPGGGWLITSLDRVPVTLADGGTFEVNRVVIDRNGQRQLVYYWFEQRGRRIANEYWMKWYLMVDALVRNRSDGALVRVTTPVGALEAAGNADQRLVDFVRAGCAETAGLYTELIFCRPRLRGTAAPRTIPGPARTISNPSIDRSDRESGFADDCLAIPERVVRISMGKGLVFAKLAGAACCKVGADGTVIRPA